MNRRYAAALLLGCSIFGVAMGAASQGPGNNEAKLNVASTRAGRPKPTNLKVLPRDISGDEIDKLMHRYKQDLGVPCGYCHEENPQTKQIDYASDENPIKETARFMIKMNEDLNTKYLAQLGDRRYAEPLTCGNCHQGQVQPPTFEPKQER
jgi:Photosynthetic reaction centre cytochrome C subunit